MKKRENIERKLNCFELVVTRLTDFERENLIKMINSCNTRIENMVDEEVNKIITVKSFCLCPYQSNRGFGFEYYCLRERVCELVDEFGDKYDLRKLNKNG